MRVAVVTCIAMVVGVGCQSVDAVKSKEEYGVLQVVEYEHRQKPVADVEIVEKDGYLIGGFRSENQSENVWVLLNPRYSPLFKQVPDGSPFTVSRRALELVRQTAGVSRDVVANLEARMVAQES